jgi:signal transduction histidine kinase
VADDILRGLDSVLRTGEMKLLEYTLSINGEERTFEARMVWGGSEKVWNLVRDITDQKRAEETRQNLTHALRLAVVGELTAMIAHEVNQPLNAILNNSETAEGLLNSNALPVKEFRDILADIRTDVLRASEAIRRVRALSQKRAIAMQRVHVAELINDVIRLVTADAMRRRVQIQSGLSANLPAVPGDPVHLQQVLLNLIINGMDAMNHLPEGQRILTVRAEPYQDDHLVIAVQDTGHGVSPDILPRIFKSFYSTKKEGMGVGLSIARSIIEAHGGRIWCENNVSGGATFRFALPLDKAPQNPQRSTASTA